MLKPLFAAGRDLERTLAQSAAAGATVLHIPTPSDFYPGDPVFVSDADGSSIEFVGIVRRIQVGSVEVSRAATAARGDSAMVWRPASWLQWRDVRCEPLDRAYHGGIAVERTSGGAALSVRTGAAWREEVLRFGGLARQGFEEFRAWLDAAVGGGVEDFTWVDETGALARVRLADADLTQREERPKTVDVDLRLMVLEDGGYA